ncbi:MAG: SAM-dependent chlorinase/fluorinase [Candidatus Eisenbacteria bacterium]|uniref:SAM-dependent chlorinase/fluorinase n=1 Tax=Eiseniibacteriota bacterium TaxID=2212470 RepID=A0A956M190_UNCEI|nr:SAM-dependent chlorinase/fluorinase [Candidatus Eisenbacteria bacterium]
MKAPCGVITLTTDFGLEDSYVGTMKGVILGIFPAARIIDITHQVNPQDTLEASLILENAYPYFPDGTIHVAVVDPGVGTSRRPIVVVTPDHVFVGPDNGTFTRIFEAHEIEAVHEISNEEFMLANVSHTFHGRDVFAPAAAHLAIGRRPEDFGAVVRDPRQSEIPVPRMYPDQICGEVIYIDNFGNVITNISRRQFDATVGSHGMRIRINGKQIDVVHRTYQDTEPGSALALFGSNDLLEIAVAGGRADRRIGAGKGDTVIVDVLGEAGRPPRETGFDY